MFQKRIADLTKSDIERVVSEAIQEGPEVEFKETLPAKAGQDAWIGGANQIGDRARNEIVEVVISFANAFGGTLMVGIAETASKPARAVGLNPIPRCADLGERLRLQCRDCIEPQISAVEVSGIVTESDGSGVVVIRVPRSRMAPHRHTVTRECYARRADRSEKMTMREIQDLTLNVERGLSAISNRFEERAHLFDRDMNLFAPNGSSALGIRVTAVPLSPLFVPKVHKNPAVEPPAINLQGYINEKRPFELIIPARGYNWRPILRGSRQYEGSNDRKFALEIQCDGLIEYGYFARFEKPTDSQRRFCLYPGWLMAILGNAICAIEKFRRGAETPTVEYGLELALLCQGQDVPVARYDGRDSFGDYLGPIPQGERIFPRYSVGDPAGFRELAELIERDFWNFCGHDWSEERLAIDFAKAFKEIGLASPQENPEMHERT